MTGIDSMKLSRFNLTHFLAHLRPNPYANPGLTNILKLTARKTGMTEEKKYGEVRARGVVVREGHPGHVIIKI